MLPETQKRREYFDRSDSSLPLLIADFTNVRANTEEKLYSAVLQRADTKSIEDQTSPLKYEAKRWYCLFNVKPQCISNSIATEQPFHSAYMCTCVHVFNSTSVPPVAFVASIQGKHKRYQMAITEWLSFSILDKWDRPYSCGRVCLYRLLWVWTIAGFLGVNG